jgi:hypothetical protein
MGEDTILKAWERTVQLVKETSLMSDTERHVTTVHVPALSRRYKITASPAGLHFYRSFQAETETWHHEGDAPGAAAAEWTEALRRHVIG